GHFLVEATSYLARALATDDYVQVAPSPAAGEGWGGGESDLLYWKRRVVEACIYGVDKNPMAVELAKLSLWLKTASADKPLSFLDHHLRHGDSLIGAWLKDLQTTPATRHAPPATSDQSPLFNEAAFTLDAGLAVKGVAVIEGLPTLDIDDVHAKEAAWRSIQQTHIAHWQRLADLWVSAYFGNSFTPPEYRALAARLQKQESLMSAEQAAHFLTHPAVTDNDYFHWELAFPEVFFDEFGRSLHEAAGFDALIGNPPYIRSIRLRDTAPQAWSYYPQAFSTASQGEYDIYICFVEQGTILLRKPGEFGFILPNKWFNSQVGKLLRKQLADHKIVSKIVDFGAFQVFAGVTTYTCLLFLHQGVHEEVDVSVLEQAEQKEQPLPNGEGIWQSGTLPQVTLAEKSWNFSLGSSRKLLKKLNELSRLQDIATVFSGAGTRADPIFQMQYKDGTLYSRALEQKVEIEDELMKPSLTGRNIDSYSVKEGYSLLFPYRINERKVELISSDEMANNYPRAWAYLNHPQNQETLKSRDKGAFYEREDWFGYGRPQNMHLLGESKIVFPDVADKAKFAYDQTGHYIIDTVYAIQLKDNCKILLATLTALLNSTVMTFFLKETGTNLRGGYFRMKTAYLNPFPIPTFHFSTQSEQRLTVVTTAKTHYTQGNHPALLAWTDAELAANRNDTIHDLLAFLAEQMITLNKEKQAALEAFWLDLEGITDAKTFDTLRNKGKQQASLYKAIPAAQPFLNADSRSSVGLDASLSWNEEAFKGFVKALAGSVSGLSKVVQVYRDHASGVAAFEQRLTSTDHLIDQIVYKLYGLTAAEIAIVEGRQS
ncbi:MAG: Eco57I restriction-modification methylase domain-containing protein, partial [Anaerolineae bacterium]|nr:Eco57I restriction-modification methylase domain-containing protein [Anaerolineae bacterium]